MKEINATFSKKQNVLRQQEQSEVRDSFLKRAKGVKGKRSRHFEGSPVSLLLADLHPDLILLFLRCQECRKCVKNLELQQLKLRSRKLTLHSNKGTEININKN